MQHQRFTEVDRVDIRERPHRNGNRIIEITVTYDGGETYSTEIVESRENEV